MEGWHPHVRGERQSSSSAVADVARFIPTCVGNARSDFQADSAAAVHPHVRGERISDRSNALGNHGSSPRAWGTLSAVGDGKAPSRFIPTCVGNARPLWLILL